jgi:FkbM family methyltransferase
MVEPEPRAFAQLSANCSGREGVKLINAAIAREPGTVRMYRVKQDYFHLHVAAPQLTSLDPGNIRKWLADRIANPDEAMETFEIRALTLPQLLAENGMTGLDVLQIDTEGYDAEIIRMIPFESLRPAVINFEILNLSKRDIESVYTLLMDHGYRLHESPMDCMAYHKSHTVLH